MKNKTCGECKFHCASGNFCSHHGIPWLTESNGACKDFDPIPKPTNGEKIRQGGDDALIDFADGIRRRMCHYCVYAKDKSCVDKTGDCWEGIRAWLNAPAESEGGDDSDR